MLVDLSCSCCFFLFWVTYPTYAPFVLLNYTFFKTQNAPCRDVARIWQGGGGPNFFFRFGNLHAAKRHAAHGKAIRFARGAHMVP